MESLFSGEGFHIIYLLGAVQGVFLAALLATRRRNSLPNKLLGSVMLVFSADLAAAVYHASGYEQVNPQFIGFDFPLGLLYGPLFFLYARTLTRRQSHLTRRDLLHFLPFVLVLLYMLPFYAMSGADKLAFLQDPTPDLRTQIMVLINHARILSAIVYVALTAALIRRYQLQIRDTYSSLERISLRWLRDVTVGLTILAGIAVIFYILELMNSSPVIGMDPGSAYDDLTLLCVTAFVYVIGYLGLRQPQVFATDQPEHGDAIDEARSIPSLPAELTDKPRYAKSGMDPEAARQHLDALLRLMETEKPYRRGDLTLADLAATLSISTHNLTEVLNTQLGQSFYDFVNGYRVREVQERLADPAAAHLTLVAIGEEAGFNSKSSFNAVFKKHTNMTPSEYRRLVGAPS
jgi:AraC-like DNA-binding protein